MQKGTRSRRLDRSPRSDAKTASAKRAGHPSAVRRRVRHSHRARQLSAVFSARAQTRAYNEAVQQKGRGPLAGTSVHLSLGGSDSGAHHGRDAAGRDAGTAFASLGRAEQIVDRGQVQGGQALSNRQNTPAKAAQGHSRRRSAFVCGKVVGSSAGRKKARTGSSNGTGTRVPGLVGGHEVMCAT